MPRTAPISPGITSGRDILWTAFLFCRICLLAVCFQIDSATLTNARTILTDNELDSVTAGGAHIDLELSSMATGSAALTSAQGSIASVLSSVLHLEWDESKPETARARLLGVASAELIFANGKAVADGGSNAQCSAVPLVAGDGAYAAQSAHTTPISATCSCAGFAVGLINQ